MSLEGRGMVRGGLWSHDTIPVRQDRFMARESIVVLVSSSSRHARGPTDPDPSFLPSIESTPNPLLGVIPLLSETAYGAQTPCGLVPTWMAPMRRCVRAL